MHMILPNKEPVFTQKEINELKQIHQKHTGEMLEDKEAREIATRLYKLFKIIGKTRD